MQLLNKVEFYNTLADLLVAEGKLNQTDLSRIQRLMEQMESGVLPALLMKDQAGGDGLPELLIRLNICSDKDVAQFAATVSGLPLVKSNEYNSQIDLESEISIR